MREIKRIFVHCTAGPLTQTIESIQNHWKKNLGWKSPGYHYIIKADGEVVQLLDENKVSNGVAGYNSTSINVCYIGGVDKQGKPIDNRTDAQKASLITVLTDLKKRYPKAEIMGHRDIWGTDPKNWKKACPCFDAATEYAHVGEQVNLDIEPLAGIPIPPVEVPEIDIPEPEILVFEPKEEKKESLFTKVVKTIIKLFKK